ncbi:hypothetical protein HOU72_gp47 [Pectobacterium phage Khlen]|uniref:Uncharacterized protein n=2 Tax=Phimunavirus TaxID=2560202 RepID=A0A3G8FID9_9CAUD|nr:hypothetical protein HOU72_gp47 [Pectobacterium phage Khlen]YP_009817255.1 hypothetical protein HOU73_gp43 [Pectobacterium phage Koot]AZF94578.1 hypothetical protein [Pectobacterium phage Khlen]AZF94629.1 hypothetical protein [Pectobacterium phage Koot]
MNHIVHGRAVGNKVKSKQLTTGCLPLILGVKMNSHVYTEYAFYLGTLSYDELWDEMDAHGLISVVAEVSSEDLRAILLDNRVSNGIR